MLKIFNWMKRILIMAFIKNIFVFFIKTKTKILGAIAEICINLM